MAQEIADSKLLDTWGSSGTKIEPDITKIIEGWQLGEQPPHEYMNWLQNTFGSKLNHILKNGVAKWNNETEYLAGATIQHNSSVWKCKITNTNSEPTDSNNNWNKMPSLENLALTVDTINDFPTSATTGDTCIVKDLDRGGIFIYDSTKVAEDNQGTNFNGWIRQYSGAVNVKWFGANKDRLDNQIPINTVLSIFGKVFIPDGTYKINGKILLNSNNTIIGTDKRFVKILAQTSDSTIECKTSHYNIRLENFEFNGNEVAEVGISLGIPNGATGSSGFNVIQNVISYNCLNIGFELNSIQYCNFFNIQANRIINGYGIKAIKWLSSSINNSQILDCKYGTLLQNITGEAVSQCNEITFNNVEFYGPTMDITAGWYLTLNGVYNIYLNRCKFENERTFTNPLVRIDRTDPVVTNGNIFFSECNWLGSSSYAQDLIWINNGSRIEFEKCRAIRPTSGNFILNNIGGNLVVVDECFAGLSYTDSATLRWSDNGYTTGTFYETRMDSFVQYDFTNKRLNINNINGTCTGTLNSISPSGTTLGGQFIGGTYTNESLAAHTAFTYGSTSNSQRGARLTANNTSYEIQGTYNNGTTDATDVTIKLNPTGGQVRSNTLMPLTDNTISLGVSSVRWSVVYAGTGTINTSDDREKTYIDITETEKKVALELKANMKKFKFNDAIEAKGDKARIHFGASAQTIKSIFENHGLNGFDYAILCYDEWQDEYKTTVIEEAVLDEEGNIVKEAVTEQTLSIASGNRYGVRYEELLSFIIGCI